MHRSFVGLCASLLVLTAASAASAQTVREFLATADSIPKNPTAMLHPATGRLMRQLQTSVDLVRTDQAALTRSGQPRTICVPDRVPVTPETVLQRFESIPQARRNITVNQAMREWLAERYPCPT